MLEHKIVQHGKHYDDTANENFRPYDINAVNTHGQNQERKLFYIMLIAMMVTQNIFQKIKNQ